MSAAGRCRGRKLPIDRWPLSWVVTTKEGLSRSDGTSSLYKVLWSKRERREARALRAPFFLFLSEPEEGRSPALLQLLLFQDGAHSALARGLRCRVSCLLIIYLSLMLTRANRGATHGTGLRELLLAVLAILGFWYSLAATAESRVWRVSTRSSLHL